MHGNNWTQIKDALKSYLGHLFILGAAAFPRGRRLMSAFGY